MTSARENHHPHNIATVGNPIAQRICIPLKQKLSSMQLSDFPPEILDEIIGWSMPLSFESLALSCKAIHTRAASKIPLHNRLKKKWKCAEHRWSRYSDNLRFLHEIAKEPLITRYIETLILHDRRDSYQLKVLEEDDANDDFRKGEAYLERIRDFFFASSAKRYIEEAGVDMDDWWNHVKQDTNTKLDRFNSYPDPTPYIDVSILLLLPNVKTVRLARKSWAEIPEAEAKASSIHRATPDLWPVLDTVVKTANGPAFSGRALGRLERVLPFMGQGYVERGALEAIQSFMQIPSVTEVYMVSCLAICNGDGYTGQSFTWRLPEYTCNVRRLELAYCGIDRGGICTVLSLMPHLEVFKYGHDVKFHGCLLY